MCGTTAGCDNGGMYIAVGSRNPAKLAGVEAAAREYWPEVEVAGVEVAHGAGFQPRSREETIGGAVARARLAAAHARGGIGVGVEGGVEETKYGMLVEIWVAAVANGSVHAGSGPSIVLPETVAAHVRAGRELGPVVDEHFRVSGQKQAGGVIALLTGGAVTRVDACRMAVLCALAPLRHAGIYAGR